MPAHLGIQRGHGYSVLAAEYYDGLLHPTCANFRTGSLKLLTQWLPAKTRARGIIEVGAGSSVVAEQFGNRGQSLSALVITDKCESMLRHSGTFRNLGACLAIADATMLPFRSNAFQCLVSSLGDAYNVKEFWSEASRVVEPGGAVLYTGPSYEWAMGYRTACQEALDVAEFRTKTGSTLAVPSLVLSEREQRQLIHAAGLVIHDVKHISADFFSKPSPKLRFIEGDSKYVVTGYLAIKPRNSKP
jgi:ubiquinone/menaquinone biosynthesis C-methylase UbiE